MRRGPTSTAASASGGCSPPGRPRDPQRPEPGRDRRDGAELEQRRDLQDRRLRLRCRQQHRPFRLRLRRHPPLLGDRSSSAEIRSEPTPGRESSARCGSSTSRRASATSRPPPRRRIVVETGPLTSAEAGLVHDLYDKGLREFAVANDLAGAAPVRADDPGRAAAAVRCRAAGDRPRPGSPRATTTTLLGPGIAVPVGGGKDSIVLVEALKAAGPPPELPTWLVAINQHPGHAAHRGRRRPAARLDHPDALAPAARAQRGRGAERPRADNRHRVAHRRGSRLRLRLRHDPHGHGALCRRGHGAGRRRRRQPPVEQEHRVRARAAVGRPRVGLRGRSSTLLRPCARAASSRSRGGSPSLPAYHAGFRSCNRVVRPGQSLRRLVRRVPEVPVRVPGAGPVPRAGPARGHLRPQPSRGPRPGRGVPGPVRGRAASPTSASASSASRCSRSCSCSSSPPWRDSVVVERAPGRARGAAGALSPPISRAAYL